MAKKGKARGRQKIRDDTGNKQNDGSVKNKKQQLQNNLSTNAILDVSITILSFVCSGIVVFKIFLFMIELVLYLPL